MAEVEFKPMSEELKEARKKYKEKFGEGFPGYCYERRNDYDAECVKIINDCIANNKDVIEMGYLTYEQVHFCCY